MLSFGGHRLGRAMFLVTRLSIGNTLPQHRGHSKFKVLPTAVVEK